MLTITIKGGELYNSKTREFYQVKDTTITLEHSLVSMSKWEAKWRKPFLSRDQEKAPKTNEESLDYIKCMTITQNVDPNVYLMLSKKQLEEINNYIANPMTATWFNERKDKASKRSSEEITSELIYYWMVALQIPFKPCEKWHLNRLLTLVRICNIKNQPEKKYSKKEIMSRNAALNAARRKKLGTSG